MPPTPLIIRQTHHSPERTPLESDDVYYPSIPSHSQALSQIVHHRTSQVAQPIRIPNTPLSPSGSSASRSFTCSSPPLLTTATSSTSPFVLRTPQTGSSSRDVLLSPTPGGMGQSSDTERGLIRVKSFPHTADLLGSSSQTRSGPSTPSSVINDTEDNDRMDLDVQGTTETEESAILENTQEVLSSTTSPSGSRYTSPGESAESVERNGNWFSSSAYREREESASSTDTIPLPFQPLRDRSIENPTPPVSSGESPRPRPIDMRASATHPNRHLRIDGRVREDRSLPRGPRTLRPVIGSLDLRRDSQNSYPIAEDGDELDDLSGVSSYDDFTRWNMLGYVDEPRQQSATELGPASSSSSSSSSTINPVDLHLSQPPIAPLRTRVPAIASRILEGMSMRDDRIISPWLFNRRSRLPISETTPVEPTMASIPARASPAVGARSPESARRRIDAISARLDRGSGVGTGSERGDRWTQSLMEATVPPPRVRRIESRHQSEADIPALGPIPTYSSIFSDDMMSAYNHAHTHLSEAEEYSTAGSTNPARPTWLVDRMARLDALRTGRNGNSNTVSPSTTSVDPRRSETGIGALGFANPDIAIGDGGRISHSTTESRVTSRGERGESRWDRIVSRPLTTWADFSPRPSLLTRSTSSTSPPPRQISPDGPPGLDDGDEEVRTPPSLWAYGHAIPSRPAAPRRWISQDEVERTRNESRGVGWDHPPSAREADGTAVSGLSSGSEFDRSELRSRRPGMWLAGRNVIPPYSGSNRATDAETRPPPNSHSISESTGSTTTRRISSNSRLRSPPALWGEIPAFPIDTIDSDLHNPLTAYDHVPDNFSTLDLSVQDAERRRAMTISQIEYERERAVRAVEARELVQREYERGLAEVRAVSGGNHSRPSSTLAESERAMADMRAELVRARARSSLYATGMDLFNSPPRDSSDLDETAINFSDESTAMARVEERVLRRLRHRDWNRERENIFRTSTSPSDFDTHYLGHHGNLINTRPVESPLLAATGYRHSGNLYGSILSHLEINDQMSSSQVASTIKTIGKVVGRMPGSQRKLMAEKVVDDVLWEEMGVGQDEEDTVVVFEKEKGGGVKRKWEGVARDESCCVCHDDYTPTSQISVTPCKHMYHRECLTTWLNTPNTSSCPMCRRDLAVLACMTKMVTSKSKEQALPLWLGASL